MLLQWSSSKLEKKIKSDFFLKTSTEERIRFRGGKLPVYSISLLLFVTFTPEKYIFHFDKMPLGTITFLI